MSTRYRTDYRRGSNVSRHGVVGGSDVPDESLGHGEAGRRNRVVVTRSEGSAFDRGPPLRAVRRPTTDAGTVSDGDGAGVVVDAQRRVITSVRGSR